MPFSTKTLICWVVAALAGALLLGCSTSSSSYDALQVDGYSVRSLRGQENDELNEKLFSAARMNTDPGDYVLGAGDLLEIKVFESEELDTTVRLSSRGLVTLPLLGQMEVKGLTAREAEVKIEEAYKERYLKDPHVSIFVKEHFSQRVTLMGQFKTPGTFDYLTKMRLIDVMALGGGLTEQAGCTAQVRRMGSSSEAPQTFLVDLDKMINEGQSELNIEINGGDVVFVPEAGMFFVDGAVRKPGAYPISRRTNLMEALHLAGGLERYAKTDQIILIRHLGKGDRQVLELTLEDREVQETPVNDRDVILVKASAFAKAMHGLGLQLGIPGVASFGYKDPEK